MIPSLTSRERHARLERIALLSAAAAAATLACAGAHATTCQPWNAATAYVAGDTVTEAGNTYKANWWTQGNDPATSNGGSGSGQPWTLTTGCTTSPPPAPTPPPPPPPTPTPPPPPHPSPAPPPSSCAAWNVSTAYNGGATVSRNGVNYQANWWTQGDDPATHSGPAGSGQPWTVTTACGTTPPPPPTPVPPPPTPVPPPPTPTPPPPTPAPSPSSGDLRPHVLMGYWQNFNNGAPVLTIAQVPTTYDIIAVAFANATGVPGQISFAIDPGVTGYSDAQFKADIVTAHGRGQKVVLSVGGQNGSISVSDSASASAFANSAASILTSYGFDGIDIDLENGINPSSMASAISQLKALQPNALVTAAPQTLDTQNSQSSYFSLASMIGANMTMMNTQYYNSGSMLGCDGGVYSQGSENFITALACTQLNSLPAAEIGIGLPATPSAAGSGYVSPSVVVAALQCLASGSNCGSFRPPANHPTIRGVMTWSINWDASNGYQFANTVSPALRALP